MDRTERNCLRWVIGSEKGVGGTSYMTMCESTLNRLEENGRRSTKQITIGHWSEDNKGSRSKSPKTFQTSGGEKLRTSTTSFKGNVRESTEQKICWPYLVRRKKRVQWEWEAREPASTEAGSSQHMNCDSANRTPGLLLDNEWSCAIEYI